MLSLYTKSSMTIPLLLKEPDICRLEVLCHQGLVNYQCHCYETYTWSIESIGLSHKASCLVGFYMLDIVVVSSVTMV